MTSILVDFWPRPKMFKLLISTGNYRFFEGLKRAQIRDPRVSHGPSKAVSPSFRFVKNRVLDIAGLSNPVFYDMKMVSRRPSGPSTPVFYGVKMVLMRCRCCYAHGASQVRFLVSDYGVVTRSVGASKWARCKTSDEASKPPIEAFRGGRPLPSRLKNYEIFMLSGRLA